MARLRDGFTKLNGGGSEKASVRASSAVTATTAKKKEEEEKWTPPKPSALSPRTGSSEKTATTAWSGDEGLPLQSFRADIEQYPQSDSLHAYYSREQHVRERGDLRICRPEYLDRRDSETEVGC